MKKAIITIVSGAKYQEIWKRSEPFFIRYAEKCDAELIVLQGVEGMKYPSPHWIKFGVYSLLKKEFDRIAYMDADIIIRDDCPSLFDIVPEDRFGIFNEGIFTPRAICIHEVKKVYNVDLKDWNGKDYYNTGVFVCSQEHRFIFKITEEIKPLRNSFGEQTYLNMKLFANPQVKMFFLSYKFNRMSLADRPTGMTRLDSYIIHYAGDGDKLLEKMDRDIKRWQEDGPEYKYKKKIFIWSMGGLGDCIAAEPSIRYMQKRVYPEEDVYVMSARHELYTHIPGIHLSEKYPQGEFDAVYEMNTHQTPWSEFGKYCPFIYVHSVDWVSLATLGRMLPDKDKQIIQTYEPEHLKESTDISERLDDLVLVHPGVGWPSKTFPVEYWQKIIDDLAELGFRVGIIGKHINKEHSVLDVKCPPTGVDFRDKLSIKGLIALISKARILITNDSAPLFMAGAFNNYIVLLPTCKHPDMILPYRNGGNKYYRAAALYKKVIEDDEFKDPSAIKGWTMTLCPPGHTIEEYIPDTDDVVDKVIDFNDQWECSHCSTKLKEIENGQTCEGLNGGNGDRGSFVESHERGFQ
jgi:lipopolysaccharide biosynthesis glycosyltransferase